MKKLSETLLQLVEILNDGNFHDGDTLGEKLGVSRSAIWKACNRLRDYGIAIESNKGKGYQLSTPLILLDKQKILKQLAPHPHAHDIEFEIYEAVTSTNTIAKQHTHNSTSHFVCLSELQTAGRGRLARHWHSPFAKNIYLSLSFGFFQDISIIGGLSLVVSLAIVKTLESLNIPAPIQIKWPNDVMCHHQKLAGTLIEIIAEANGESRIVVGIGINCNMIDDSVENIDQPWTSLQKITGDYQDRNQIAAELIKQLIDHIQQFTQHGLQHFLPQWEKYDMLAHRSISVLQHNQILQGIAEGIDNSGQLKLRLENGNIISVSSGDTLLK